MYAIIHLVRYARCLVVPTNWFTKLSSVFLPTGWQNLSLVGIAMLGDNVQRTEEVMFDDTNVLRVGEFK